MNDAVPAKRRPGRPPRIDGRKRHRSLRTEDVLWTTTEAIAKRLGMTTTAYVEQAIHEKNQREDAAWQAAYDKQAETRLHASTSTSDNIDTFLDHPETGGHRTPPGTELTGETQPEPAPQGTPDYPN